MFIQTVLIAIKICPQVSSFLSNLSRLYFQNFKVSIAKKEWKQEVDFSNYELTDVFLIRNRKIRNESLIQLRKIKRKSFHQPNKLKDLLINYFLHLKSIVQLSQFDCALSTQNSKINARFAGKHKINEDHYHFRFFLENPDQHLGTKVGQAIKLTLNSKKTNQISRYYSLVTDPFSKGYLDCIVKDLDKSNYNDTSNPMVPQLLQMKNGTNVVIEEPYTQYIYHGLGNLTYKKNFKAEFQTGKFDKIGIIAHNSAITTFSQLIQGVISSRDPTQINLLFHNHKIQDEYLLDEMTRFFLSHNMKYTPVLQNAKPSYYGFKGEICEKSIEQTLPNPRENYVLMMQGPRPFKEKAFELLLKMGYNAERIAYM